LSLMVYIHAMVPEQLLWTVYAATLLACTLADGLLALVIRRGFGGRGFGRRGFGRGLGPFRLIRLARIVFVLLFTTILGPIVLVALLVFAGYWFFANRRS
jgi:hypothetical protein